MKFDKEKLAALMALPDEELWRVIKQIADQRGLELPANPPSHSEMERMRGAVGDGGRLNLSDAMRVINTYRKGN